MSPPAALAAALAAWGESARRDLPWRRTRDPWAVLVSEVMLQQTQAARVAPRWVAWQDRWPGPPDVAAAGTAELLTAWSGLGYPRRALRLREAARAVCERHAGRVPSDLAGLRALPGVGPYTARAVLAFAFEQPVGVVDVNAARVLARAAAGRPLRPAEAQVLADDLVPPGRAWAHNQAVLDLGATTCTARRPACGSCPLAAAGCCAWRAAGGPAAGSDPAVGSAATTRRQAPFAGSDRQARGALLRSLAAGPVAGPGLAAAAGLGPDDDRAAAIAAGLVADGLAAARADGGLDWPDR